MNAEADARITAAAGDSAATQKAEHEKEMTAKFEEAQKTFE